MPYEHYGKWRARWLDESGHPCSKTFDDHRSAKAHEQKMKAAVAEIRAGLRRPTPTARTFAQLTEQWLATRALRKRSRTDDESILKRHLLPAFGAVALGEVDVARVDQFVAERGHLSPKTIANHLTLLIAMLNLARDLGWIDRTPRIRKRRVRVHGKDFAFLRTAGDVRRFLEAARAEGEVAFAMYATAVYTGARAGELAALRWDNVDFDQRLITIQKSFDGPCRAPVKLTPARP
jgi:integrase